MSKIQIEMCNVNTETGYCQRCGCWTKNDDEGGFYCTALEDDMKAMERNHDEYAQRFIDEYGYIPDDL